jgi:hypothetical protein
VGRLYDQHFRIGGDQHFRIGILFLHESGMRGDRIVVRRMSALPPKADIRRRHRDVS